MYSTDAIIDWKNQILSELQNNDEIISALGINSDEDEDDLIWKRIFPHYYVEPTQEQTKTYICVEINIPETRVNRYTKSSDFYSHPQIIFYVISHQNDMKMSANGKSATRTDYIGKLIEDSYNGRTGFGVGKLQRKSNVEGALNDTFRTRIIVFDAVEIDKDLC